MLTEAVFFFANETRVPAALVFAYSAKRTFAVFCAEFHAVERVVRVCLVC